MRKEKEDEARDEEEAAAFEQAREERMAGLV